MTQNNIDCTTEEALSLLCTENQNLCFDDLGGGVVVDPTDPDGMLCEDVGKDDNFTPARSDPLNALPCLSEEEFEAMIVREMENLPKGDYLLRLRKGDLDMSVRKECIEWIWKAHAHYGFTEQCFAMAVNYYDRFMSVYELPRGTTWANQLLAIACLSLAAKMEEVEVPLTVDLQVGEPKAIFEGKTIRRMELLVLNALGWKLHAYTPCTFIDYFLIKITNGKLPFTPLIAKAVQIIISTIKGIDFLEFRPCEIAAAVALSVLGEIEAMDTDKALSCFKQVEKDRVLKCIEMIHNLKLISLSSSPNGVLEAAACMSCKTDGKTVGSCPNSYSSQESEMRNLDCSISGYWSELHFCLQGVVASWSIKGQVLNGLYICKGLRGGIVAGTAALQKLVLLFVLYKTNWKNEVKLTSERIRKWGGHVIEPEKLSTDQLLFTYNEPQIKILLSNSFLSFRFLSRQETSLSKKLVLF